MWHTDFADRLESWSELRTTASSLPLEQVLQNINEWWFRSPWKSYYLHWDDQPTWPDPWQLLSDDIYCDLARALGILYTITLLNRADMTPASLVLTEDGYNLVLVGKTKYILNWESDCIVNTSLEVKIKRHYQQHQIL